jgi:hypothetical protein
MKKTVIFMLAMVSVSLVYAQKISDKEVPAAVKSALQKKYPNAKDLKWEKEKGNYEAEFEVTKTDYSLLMDASGNVLETEVEIKTEQLPAAAKSYVAKKLSRKENGRGCKNYGQQRNSYVRSGNRRQRFNF